MANKTMHHVVIGSDTFEIVDQYAREHSVTDTTLSISGAAADAKATGDAVNGLNERLGDIKSVSDTTNEILLTKSVYTYQSTADKTLNTSGWTSVLSGYSVSSALDLDGMDYIMAEYTLTMTGSQRAVMFFTTSSLGTGVVDSSISVTSGELIPIPDGAHYVRLTFPTNTPPVIYGVKKNRLITNTAISNTEVVFNDQNGDAVTSFDMLDTGVFYVTNYVIRNTDNEGKYLNLTNGTLSSNDTYFTTDFIKVNPGDVLYSLYQMRFIAGYGKNAENAFVSTSTATNVYTYTVPNGVYYIRVTGYASAIDNYIITKGFAPAEYAEPGTKIKPEYYESPEQYNTVGGGRMSANASTLASGTQITLSDFPKNLKKGVAISFCADFESFTSLAIGKGYDQYRGDWIEIDSINIVWKHYEESEQIKSTTPHGLTISDFLMVALDVDSTNSATCHITIATKGGSASFNSAWEHEQNGTPFAFGGQDMTHITLSAVASDIRCPMWLFGDSYFGVYGNRVLGQLIDIGYAENVLLDALAGQTPANALLELKKLMSLGGVPKFIVWTLGMNGTASAYSTALATLEAIADKYDITLILYKVPTVPTRKAENNAVNTAVTGSGRRYIDAFKAVGDDADGNWIDGYLSSDGVHPTSLGARAIAMRILVDVPEIMQYGYSPMDIDGNATGDL